MFKEPRFAGEPEKQERETQQELVEKGGIFYSEEIDPETQEKKATVNILGIELETYASAEDINKIKEELVLDEVSQGMLRSITESYKLREPLLFEGEPAAGKTFLLKKFVQMIHGKDAPILEMTGTPRTSELEILGHWAPRGKASDEDGLGKILDRLRENKNFVSLQDGFGEKMAELSDKLTKKDITEEEFKAACGEASTRYEQESRQMFVDVGGSVGVSKDAEWEFKKGTLLEAYSGNNGRGRILIVDEFNIIPSNFQQIFLQIGGEGGALSDKINFFGNSGKTQYKAGKDTWVAFAMNFPEKTLGRSEVVPPMTDRVVWKTIGEKETETKGKMLRRTGYGRLKKRSAQYSQIKPENFNIPVKDQLKWDEVLNESLGEQIVDIADNLHEGFVALYKQLGDTLEVEGGRGKRSQKIASGRSGARFLSYIDNMQVRSAETGQIDFKATLKNAFKKYYTDRLVSNEQIAKANTVFDGIMTGAVGQVNFENKPTPRGKVLDILTERATSTPEEKKKLEEREKTKKQNEQKNFKNSLSDKLSGILNNPNISDEVKRKLGAK